VVASVLFTWVMEAAREALSSDPVPPAIAAITSILLANDEDVLVNVVFVVVILAANDALLFVIALDSVSIFCAALELFVVIVP
jgi:hypothetical protein